MSNFVNEFKLSNYFLKSLEKDLTVLSLDISNLKGSCKELLGIFTDKEVNNLLENIDKQNWIPVGLDGILTNYQEGDEIGSYRLSCYEPKLASVLYDRIKEYTKFSDFKIDNIYTDLDNSEWEPIGINPLFRFIRYTDKGLLVPHYDGSYIENEEVRSLKSLVIYLEGDGKNGATRFLKDPQIDLPLESWDMSDWDRVADKSDILYSIYGNSGDSLLFDHFLLHDSEPMLEGQKTIIRTDVMYRKLKKGEN